MKRINKNLFFIYSFIFYLGIHGCSNQDENESCPTEIAVMEIDGITRNFNILGVSLGTGIFGRGTEIQLNLDSRDEEVDFFRQQTIVLTFPFEETGDNLISEFLYSQNFRPDDFPEISGDFLNGEFQSNIDRNSRFCLTASFSGRLSQGNDEVIIENGELVFILNDRFDEDELFP